jgi:hypothetical protein
MACRIRSCMACGRRQWNDPHSRRRAPALTGALFEFADGRLGGEGRTGRTARTPRHAAGDRVRPVRSLGRLMGAAIKPPGHALVELRVWAVCDGANSSSPAECGTIATCDGCSRDL